MDSSRSDPKNSLFFSLDWPLIILTATCCGMPWAWLTCQAKSSRSPLHFLQKMHFTREGLVAESKDPPTMTWGCSATSMQVRGDSSAPTP